MAEHGDSLNGRLRSRRRGGGGEMTRERRVVVCVWGGFKLGNDGKINEFKRIIGSKREKKNRSQQTT